MIWILFAVVTACVILAIARPLWRAAVPVSSGASEIEAYKMQLGELAREHELGRIGNQEAEQTRMEISRRLLKAGRQSTAAVFFGKPIAFNAKIAFAALAAVIVIGTGGLYAVYGSPSLSDQPLEARLDAASSEQPMAIQIANVERRLRQNPNDAAGWSAIAPAYFANSQFDKAAEAYRRAINLAGQNEANLLGLFESLVYNNEGTISAEAKSLLDTALAKNPKSPRGRIWLAIFAGQDGRKADAEQIYREMLGENIGADWKAVINKQLTVLTAGPEDQQKIAQHSASEGDQSGINGMVDRLAARLKENGADLQGWLMLIRSYHVLKQPAKVQEAVASARKQFASEPQALEQIDALNGALASAPAKADAQPSDNAQPPASAPMGGQAAMIPKMVERLAARLKENGADLDGWLRLIRSYAVMKDAAKAQDAVASARKQFASEPQALEQIDALTRETGLAAAEDKPAASGGAPAGDHSATMNGMVDRLAARLKENGANLDGWLMLIRSYAVLKEPAKAQEAAASARKQFASEPEALGKIDSLTRGLSLAPEDGKGGQPK